MVIVNKWLGMRMISVARVAGLIQLNRSRSEKRDNVGRLREETESEAVSPGVVLGLSHLKYF